MKLVSGDIFWTDKTPINKQHPYLDRNIDCTVCIIGGGITGALASYYFRKNNIDVVLVDKNIIGYGSTSASTAVLQYEIDTTLTKLSKMIGDEQALLAYKFCYDAVYEIDRIAKELNIECGFEYKDCFYYTHDASGIKAIKEEYRKRKECNYDVKFVNKETAKKLFDFKVEAGIYSEFGSAIIDPYRFSTGIINRLAKDGLTVYENTEIVDMNCSNRPQLTTNNGFTINCDKVIIASGYEGRKHIEDNFIDLYRTYTVISEPVDSFKGWYKKCTIRDDKDPYTYIRVTSDNRVIVGGEDEKIGVISNLLGLENGDKHSDKKYNILINRFKEYFPQMQDINFKYKYNGLYGSTTDGLPYIGEYDKLPNCYFTLDIGGNGILYAVTAGMLLAKKYMGNEVPELDIYRFGR